MLNFSLEKLYKTLREIKLTKYNRIVDIFKHILKNYTKLKRGIK